MRARFYFFTFLVGLTACGGGGGDSTSSDPKPTNVTPAFQPSVALSSWQDPGNVYSHFKNKDGECLSRELEVSCENKPGEQDVTQFKKGLGFLGVSFGLEGKNYTSIDIDPDVEESIVKYSGALATYTSKHAPVAVESDKYTYFTFSGPVMSDGTSKAIGISGQYAVNSAQFRRKIDGESNILGIYIARYNHESKRVSAPVLLHAKNNDDPHDNGVLNLDNSGNLYVLISGRGAKRGAFMYFIKRPDDVAVFDHTGLEIKDISPDNLNYTELNTSITTADRAGINYPKLLKIDDGFRLIYTIYCHKHVSKTCAVDSRQLWSAKISYSSDMEKAQLSQVRPLAAFGGHYAVAAATANGKNIAVAFNTHLNGKVDARTNLSLLVSRDSGENWDYFEKTQKTFVSAQSLLPVRFFQDLEKINIKQYHTEGDTVMNRVFLKDIYLRELTNNDLSIDVVTTVVTGEKGHEPSLSDQHQLVRFSYDGSQWREQVLTNKLDHNFSNGFIKSTGENQFRFYYPATENDNNNAMAGGRAAYLDFDESSQVSQVNYLTAQRKVGQKGYLKKLCEVNYIRGVEYQKDQGFVAVFSANNPYEFEGLKGHSTVSATPIYILNSYSELLKLPMMLEGGDDNDEYALETIDRGEQLQCQL